MDLIPLPELALALRTSQSRIRGWLNTKYGGLPADLLARGLTEELANEAHTHFAATVAASAPEWVLEVGDTVRRRLIHSAYGGQRQGGISTPAGNSEILVFTNPDSGAQYGYDKFEGLREDGSYAYTGEGQVGDHVFKKGNRAILESGRSGKTLRLFRTHKTLATYIGEFQLDTIPYRRETIPDVYGNPRLGIIFNLIPISAKVDLLPAFGGELPSPHESLQSRFQVSLWDPPESSSFEYSTDSESFGVDRVVSRVEFALQSEFGAWLTSQRTPPQRLRLRVGNSQIEPDFYVPSRQWIVEAKKSPSRGNVRMAIGQVLDYVHIARKAGLEAQPAVLLPGMPEPDLIQLMLAHGINCVVKDANGFEWITADSPTVNVPASVNARQASLAMPS